MKEISIDDVNVYDSRSYPSNGFYIVNNTSIVLVIKEKNMTTHLGDYTEIMAFLIAQIAINEVEEIYGMDFSQFKEINTKSKIPIDDVLKLIAISKDPTLIDKVISEINLKNKKDKVKTVDDGD